MPEHTDPVSDVFDVPDVSDVPAIAARVRSVAAGLTALLAEADTARSDRAETRSDGDNAVCAWNHFENIPTFYNWNNRPR